MSKHDGARRLYPVLWRCERCGRRRARERHHVDGDPGHNEPGNLLLVCSRCHASIHGKQALLAGYAKAQTQRTHCPHGHEYTPENTRVYKGRRFCRECTRIASREYKRRTRATPFPQPEA